VVRGHAVGHGANQLAVQPAGADGRVHAAAQGRTWPGVSAMMAASNFQLPTSTTATVPVSARSIMCAAAARLVETAVPSGLTPAMPAASSSARRASGLAHAAP